MYICYRFLREGQRSLALLALKRKKDQMRLVHEAEEHLFQVNQLISNVEVASLQIEVVKAIQAGTIALKAIQSEISVDFVQRLVDENSDLRAEVSEIGQMLSGVEGSDPEVYEELCKLENEISLEKQALLPTVPSSVPESFEPPSMNSKNRTAAKVSEDVELVA
jgi:charged multivesicular body protein 6